MNFFYLATDLLSYGENRIMLPHRSPLSLLPIYLLALILLTLPAATGCSRNADPVTSMPAFSLTSAQDGSTIHSRDFAGQTLVVAFFATWCPPCRQEVPTLIALQEKYGNGDFTVLGISVDQGDARGVRNFMSELGINYPVVMSGPDTPRNFGDVFGIPTTFLIDRQGEIIQRFDGYVDIRVLERELQAVL